jgi:hypothetical protein
MRALIQSALLLSRGSPECSPSFVQLPEVQHRSSTDHNVHPSVPAIYPVFDLRRSAGPEKTASSKYARLIGVKLEPCGAFLRTCSKIALSTAFETGRADTSCRLLPSVLRIKAIYLSKTSFASISTRSLMTLTPPPPGPVPDAGWPRIHRCDVRFRGGNGEAAPAPARRHHRRTRRSCALQFAA